MKILFFTLLFAFFGYTQTVVNTDDIDKKINVNAKDQNKSDDGLYELPKDTIKFKIISVAETPKNLMQKAYFYGFKLLNACNHSKISRFNEADFTSLIFKKLNLDYISNVCRNINREFGEFQDLRFVETIENEKTKIQILRFKCIYKKKYSTKELRVGFDPTGRIVSIRTLKWNAEFKPTEKKQKKLYAKEIDQNILDSLDQIIKDLELE
jgi:hypothetical protein